MAPRTGSRYALPDCSSIEGPQGSAAPLQNFLNYGNPAQPHDTRGYPQLTEWGPTNLTYEGTYWRWIQRAWLAGLRLMVMGVNENRVLCELQANRTTDCDEMDTVRRGLRRHAASCSATSTRRPAGRARASSRSSPTRSRRAG